MGFVFAALALGMACGTGFYYQAILFTLFLCALLLLLGKLSVGRAEANEAVVRVTTGAGSNTGAMESLEAALKSAGTQPVLINRVLEGTEFETISWRVRTGGAKQQGELQERLRAQPGVRSVGVYVMDDFQVL